MKRYSPAKINLHLRVLGKRDDGYHDLFTLMQRISISDVMAFRSRSHGITLRCPGYPELETPHNLAYRAAQTIIDAAGGDYGVDIMLEKRTPVAAGLGGGSSNAATTLLAVNEMMGLPFTRDDLARMGRQLGADVPFFVYERNAWATGIGDELTAAPDLPSFHVLLVNPGFPLSTRHIYEALNFRLTKKSVQYNIPRLLDVRDIAELLRNDLENVAITLHPVIGTIKDRLHDCGAIGTLMSGSGPTVFGIFPSERKMKEAEEELAVHTEWKILAAHTI